MKCFLIIFTLKTSPKDTVLALLPLLPPCSSFSVFLYLKSMVAVQINIIIL